MASTYSGIGGWVYAPWRGVFYPDKLPQARELEYASRQVTAIEINGTFYGTQKPSSFRKWHDETPDGFVFALKGPRYATHRRALGEAAESVERFVGSGILELKAKLGPILWQLMGSARFDPDNIEAFLKLLPHEAGGRQLRHVLEVGHESFNDPKFVALLRQYKVAVAMVEDEGNPLIQDATADFMYARLKRAEAERKTGYPPKAIDAWAARARTWNAGGEPDDIVRIDGKAGPKQKRDCFIFFISGAKERNPAAAMELVKRMKE